MDAIWNWFIWLESTDFSTWVREGDFIWLGFSAFYVILGFHSIGMAIVVGVTLMLTTQYGLDSAVSFGAVAGIDLLRLTVYRQTLLKWWQNPSSSGAQTARSGPSLSF